MTADEDVVDAEIVDEDGTDGSSAEGADRVTGPTDPAE